ncbi:MAG TPA: 50S ribosomal protein L11 methyltransferase [Polyangiaceae bacterium]|nr:50S ribosomal protein L11 methyltransferase [Polyangiaceae bacterium]
METYFCLEIAIPHRDRDWLAEQLARQGFSAFEERSRPGGACLVIYAQSRASLEHVASELRSAAQARRPGLAPGCKIERAPEDWALGWTEYLKPVQLTPTLTLHPNAPPAVPDPGALYLEPAFAFGFGEHPSTRLLASWVEARCRAHPGCSLLDVGCGTGVLALVACKSGAGRVLGVDTSEPAVQAARANAALNRLPATFLQQDGGDLDERFDYVVANIEAPVLIAASPAIARCARGARAFALSGFISEQVPELVQRYAQLGLALHLQGHEEDWCLLSSSDS